MKLIIYLLGFACIAYCTYLNLHTRHAANALKSMFQSYQLKYLAAIPAVRPISEGKQELGGAPVETNIAINSLAQRVN